MHQDIKSLDVPFISSAQNQLKDPARLEDAAQSSPSDTLSCLEMVLQGASLCVCTAASPQLLQTRSCRLSNSGFSSRMSDRALSSPVSQHFNLHQGLL